MAEAEATAAVETVVAEPIKQFRIDMVEPTGDYWPGLILGINACVGTAWWLLSWFVYVKNSQHDSKLKSLAGVETIPIGFFWERISEFGGSYTYLGLSLFFTFVSYIIVSLVEVIAWIFYLIGDPAFFGWYVNIMGYYGSIVFYILPPVFSIFYIAITLEGRINQNPGAYAVFLTVVGTAMWLLNSFLHIFYAERLAAHISKTVPYFDPDYKVYVAKVPAPRIICKIPKGQMTEEQYRIACAAINSANQAKASVEEGGRASPEDDTPDVVDDATEEADESF